MQLRTFPGSTRTRVWGNGLALGAVVLAGAAGIVHHRARQAERDYPPRGKFVTSHGVRLHVIEKGSGPPVLYLHGNGGMTADILISGIVDESRGEHRAIVIDRPGFGYSERPRGRIWDAAEQALLLPDVFSLLNAGPAVVFGHSWGALVALALALDHPHLVKSLVLASGYYYPSARSDAAVSVLPATPVLGDVIRHTVAPFIGEAVAAPLIKKLFSPEPVTERFAHSFPVPLTLRPSQLRALAEDTATMAASASQLSPRYAQIQCPVRILTGSKDAVVSVEQQAFRLHREIASSKLDVVDGAGHMIHHTAPARVAAAIRSALSDGGR